MKQKFILPVLAIGLILVGCNGNTDSKNTSDASSATSLNSEVTISSASSSLLDESSTVTSSSLESSEASYSEDPDFPDYNQSTSWPSKQIADFFNPPSGFEVPSIKADKYFYKIIERFTDSYYFQIVCGDFPSSTPTEYIEILTKAGYIYYSHDGDYNESFQYRNNFYLVSFSMYENDFCINIYRESNFITNGSADTYDHFPYEVAGNDLDLSFDLFIPEFKNVKNYYYHFENTYGTMFSGIYCPGVTKEEYIKYALLYNKLGYTCTPEEDNYFSTTSEENDVSLIFDYREESQMLGFYLHTKYIPNYLPIDSFDINLVNAYLKTTSTFNITPILSSSDVCYFTNYNESFKKYLSFKFTDKDHPTDNEFYKNLCINEGTELDNQGYAIQFNESNTSYSLVDYEEQLKIELTYDEEGVYYEFLKNR